MAFNITSWCKRGRDFARGAPPPRGSVEYVGVGDMWEPEPPRPSRSGFSAYKVSYTDLDAAQRWVNAVDRGVRQARTIHKDEILSAADERSWDALLADWRPLAHDLRLIPGRPAAMLPSAKTRFDDLLQRAKSLHDEFSRKGMSAVPVPYAGELLLLLRQTPKKLTAAEMAAKLDAGAKCGEKMLDANTAWYSWAVSRDHVPLERSVEDARAAAEIYSRSARSRETYVPGDPVYDEFLRRLSKIWIEAAGLYGIREVKTTARSQLADDLRDRASTLPWLLAAAGVAYLGVTWITRPRAEPARVAVPDAVPSREETP